jgi:PAS domain S-box-containing protein
VKTTRPQHLETDDELHRFFELSLDMLCIAGTDGYFKRINAAWEKTLGHSMAHLLTEPYLSFVHPEDREATMTEAQKIGAGTDTIWFENRYRCADGSYKWLLWRATSPPGSQMIYAAARDITEHKAADEALERSAQELQRSNRELEQFASVASHDLKEPLRMITSYLDLLQRRYRGKLDADADTFIGYAVDGAGRMRALIEDLLAYSRVGSGELATQAVSLEKVLAQVLSSLQVAIAEAGAQITHDPLPTLEADPIKMSQLLQNLVANAVKFRGKAAPRVHVEARRTGGEWEIAVSDNGIGIEPRHFEKLFTVFHRLHTRAEYPGTGLGLAVCKKIVERHGGRIWIESTPGEGTTFRFTLPLH